MQPAASIWIRSPMFQRPSLSPSSGNYVMGGHCVLLIYIISAPSCTAIDQWGVADERSQNHSLGVTAPGTSVSDDPVIVV
jgi:hypothetical protein